MKTVHIVWTSISQLMLWFRRTLLLLSSIRLKSWISALEPRIPSSTTISFVAKFVPYIWSTVDKTNYKYRHHDEVVTIGTSLKLENRFSFNKCIFLTLSNRLPWVHKNAYRGCCLANDQDVIERHSHSFVCILQRSRGQYQEIRGPQSSCVGKL